MSDNKECAICSKALQVPPNEFVHPNKHAHTLCMLQLQSEHILKMFGALQKIVTGYEKACDDSTPRQPVRHDVYMERVQQIIKQVHSRTTQTQD